MERFFWTLLAIFLIAMVILKHRPAAPPQAPAVHGQNCADIIPAQETDPRRPLVTTEEREAFVSYFFPLVDEIRRDFPVQSLRSRFNRFFERVESREIPLTFSPEPSKAHALAEASPGGVLLAVPDFIEWTREMSREEVKIFLIELLLHEEYHFDHHVFRKLPEEVVESETWWWSVENIFLPLKEAEMLNPDKRFMRDWAIYSYKKAQGDKSSPVWKRFLKVATIQAPEFKGPPPPD